MSSDMADLIVSLDIDEERKHIITKVDTNNKTSKITKNKYQESDHNTIIAKFYTSIEIETKIERIEIFNLKDEQGLNKYIIETETNPELINIVNSMEDMDQITKNFMKKFKDIKHKCFKKVRITNKDHSKIDNLFQKRKILKSKDDKESKSKLREIEEELAEKLSEDLYGIIKTETEKINCEEGGFNSGHLWSLKNKLYKKYREPPTAIMNKSGDLVTSNCEINKATLEHFTNLLENKNSNAKYVT